MATPKKKKTTLVIKNIGQLVTMQGPVPRRGRDMSEIGLVTDGAVAVSGDEILAVGKAEDVSREIEPAENCVVLSADNRVVTPGLIDPHTHPIFARTREFEFEMRLMGKGYMEIAQAGGGIRASVRHLREMEEDKLYARAKKTLDMVCQPPLKSNRWRSSGN
jgi:imidazolonepropionase